MKYRKREPEVVEALTFDEFVAYGLAHVDRTEGVPNIQNGMPWSFKYAGYPVSHENDNLYLICAQFGDPIHFGRGAVLVTDELGALWVSDAALFDAEYVALSSEQEERPC